MKTTLKLIFVTIIVLANFSCKQNAQPTEMVDQKNAGKVIFTFDKVNAPSDVKTLMTVLSRSGYSPKQQILNIFQDTGAAIIFDQVEIGTWSIQVDAKNDSGKVLYSGKSEVIVYENFVSQVNLFLTKISEGVGSVQINITWGVSEYGVWEENVSNPVLQKPDSINMSSGIYLPKVLIYNGKYYMWYNMSTSQGGVGVATSVDGKQWTHHSKASIIPVGQNGAWDGSAVGIGAILYDNGIFKMYFNAFDNTSRFRIGYAYSADGLHWHKEPNPVFEGTSNWNYSSVSSSVIKNDSGYYLYYSARANFSSNYVIGVAYSKDGVKFEGNYDKPILSPTQNWESTSIYWPSIVSDGNQFVMVYMNGSGGTRSAFGIAKSNDGILWQKLTSNPIFSWTKYHNAWSSSEIAYPCLLKSGQEIRLYYSGYSVKGYSIGYAVKK